MRPWRASSPAPSSAELTLSQGPLPFGGGPFGVLRPRRLRNLAPAPAVCPLREAHMTIKRIYRAAFPHKDGRFGNLNSGSAQFGRRPSTGSSREARPGQDLGLLEACPTSLGRASSPAPSSADLTLSQGPLPFRLGTLGLRNWAPAPALCPLREAQTTINRTHPAPFAHKDGRFGNLNSGSAQFGRRPSTESSREARPGQDLGLLEVCPTTCTPPSPEQTRWRQA